MRLGGCLVLLLSACASAGSSDDAGPLKDLSVRDAPPGVDFTPTGDLSMTDLSGHDLARPHDLAHPIDLAMADLTTPIDLSTPIDMSMPPDLSTSPDLSTPPDLTSTLDFAMPIDLSNPIDMSTPPDLTSTVDLTTPPDLSACHPVINELQTASSTSGNQKWLEIYNPCSSLDLTNWSVSYRSASNISGSPTPMFTFTTNITNPYILLAYTGTGGYTGGMVGTVAIDGSWTVGALAAAGGAVALLNPSSAIIDAVGYGNVSVMSPYVEGTPMVTTPAAGQSLGRFPNGTDNNNNSTDFSVRTTETPRAINQ
jgi:hypothetical protein